jgi:hypothetical protein
MPPARLLVIAAVSVVSFAHAGAVIILVPTPLKSEYNPGEVLRVDVLAQLDTNGPANLRVRYLQFDFSQTDPRLEPVLLLTHPDTETHGDIYFWDFSTASSCQNEPTFCGVNHLIDDDLDGDTLVSVTNLTLTEDVYGLRLSQAEPRRIGQLQIVVPNFTEQDSAVLDLLNADDHNPNQGARMTYRSGITPVYWSAEEGSIAGGRLGLAIVPEPGTVVIVSAGILLLVGPGRRRQS